MGDTLGGPSRLAVIMTCHNRRDTTARCLQALEAQVTCDAELHLFVTDDGSTDGTAATIRSLWPGSTIIQGTGTLFWAAGMALAERAAIRDRPDYLLWLNDDTDLHETALAGLLATAADHPGAIIVGAVTDPQTRRLTYGGRVRVDWHPQRFSHLPISDHPQQAHTFNGNVVLIPWRVREKVGPIDGLFPHAYADDDYGLRATALGVSIVQMPGSVGHCSQNPPKPPLTGGPIARWRALQAPTSVLPWRAQSRYLRRHGDWRWPLLLAGGQIRRMVRSLR